MGGGRRKELRRKNTKEGTAQESSPFFRRYESISNTLKNIGKEPFKSILKETLKEVAKETFFIATDIFIAPGMGTTIRTLYEAYRLTHKAEKYAKLTKDYLKSNESFFESNLSKEIVKDISKEIIKGEIRSNTEINNFATKISDAILNDNNTRKFLEERNVDKEIFTKIFSNEIKAALKGAGKELVNKVVDKVWNIDQKEEKVRNEKRRKRKKRRKNTRRNL